MKRREEAKGVAGTATPTRNNTDRQPLNCITKCVRDVNLPCCGECTFCSSKEQLVCSSCAPAGIAITRLTEQQQVSILLEVLLAYVLQEVLYAYSN